MLKRRWIKRFNILSHAVILTSCGSTTGLEVKYFDPPQEMLSSKPLLIRPANPESRHLANLVRIVLSENGYRLLQDTGVTAEMLKPYGANQVQPLSDYTEIETRLTFNSPEENTVRESSEVILKDCNYLREKKPCRYRKGRLRRVRNSVSVTGDAELTIRKAGKPPAVLALSFSATSGGSIPAATNADASKKLKTALEQTLSKYLMRRVEVKPGVRIDTLAHDLITSGLYDAAAIRVKRHEGEDDARFYALGYIEELRGNYSGAKNLYETGGLETGRSALFDSALKRIEKMKKRIN